LVGFEGDLRAVAMHYTALWPPLPHESGVVSYAVARPCATFDSPWSDTGLRKCSGLISHELCVRIRTFGARSTRTAQSKESLSPLGTYSATIFPTRPLSHGEGSRVRRARRQAAYVMITHSNCADAPCGGQALGVPGLSNTGVNACSVQARIDIV
jgi:hypothetical protein